MKRRYTFALVSVVLSASIVACTSPLILAEARGEDAGPQIFPEAAIDATDEEGFIDIEGTEDEAGADAGMDAGANTDVDADADADAGD